LVFLSLNRTFVTEMKIGSIEFGEQPLFLAPMEDVTDIGFRKLCKRFGAAMVYTEFVSAEALVRDVKSTVDKLTISDEERPVGIQLYGRDVEAMVEAAKIVEQAQPDVIDLNFGCPVKKVAGKGAGAGMLRNIPLLLDITREVVKAVKTPVTVKTRLGWDQNNLVITELAEQLQDCGIQALTIHGRTRSQMYTGEADWTLIGEVKNNPRIHIPIIGNGDIKSADDVKNAFDRFGVDAVMIGRATFGAPWVFQEWKNQQTHPLTPPCMEGSSQVQAAELFAPPHLGGGRGGGLLSIGEKIDILLEQLHINVERIDERRGILHTRRHLAASPIFKGIPDFRQTRIAMLRAETVSELTEIIEQVRKRLVSA
jgi:nifR3 family TIM-barrel protein